MAVVNGTFETGDFTGWDVMDGSPSVQSAVKNGGTYAAKFNTTSDNIRQEFTSKDTDIFSFYTYVQTLPGGGSFTIEAYNPYYEQSESLVISSAEGGWTNHQIDISGITAESENPLKLKFECSGSGTIAVYLDDVEFKSGAMALAGLCSTGTECDGWLSGTSIILSGTSSTGTSLSSFLAGIFVALSGTMSTGTGLSGLLGLIIPLSGTMSTATAFDAYLKLFLAVENENWLSFDSGSSAFTVGEVVTGETSGATGTVISVQVTSGSWGAGTAAGVVILGDVVGEFIDNEDLDGSTAGDDAATSDGTLSYVGPKVIRRSASKGIEDIFWTATIVCRGLYSKSEVGNFRDVEIIIPDHTNTDQQVFLGIVPDIGVTQKHADKQTIIKAVSHTWYLANRQLPNDYLTNVTWVPSGATGYITYLEPSVLWTAFLGGVLWNTVTGIYPSNLVPVADWNVTRPAKKWGWNKSVKRWDAVQEMILYLDYIFEAIFDGGSRPLAVACPIDEISTYLGPAAVTLSDNTYILSVSKESKDTEKPSLVTVTVPRNRRRLNFINGTYAFSAEAPWNIVLDGTTGAEATILSCTLVSGSWAGDDAAGYLIISYDRTGPFVDGDTIVCTLGAIYGQATMQGNDEPNTLYDYYTYSYPETEPVRAREYFEDLDEEYDSTPLAQAQALALYNFLQLDNTPYTVVFNKRTDFRLWQKIKITHRTDVIPAEWMRVVHISYDQVGVSRQVTCILKNAAYVESMVRMKKLSKYSDAKVIDEAIKNNLKKMLKIDDGEVLKVEGEYFTTQLINGEVVTTLKGTE